MRADYLYVQSADDFARKFPALPSSFYEGADLYNKKTGRMMDQPQRGEELCRPYVCSDVGDYESPVSHEIITHRDGRRELKHKWISGRAARREDLKRNDCVEMDSPEAGARHRGISTKYAKTLKDRQPKRPKLTLPEDRVLNNKLEAVFNGARNV
jgi:hypothetical protein